MPDDTIPSPEASARHEAFVRNVAPVERNEQEPLGSSPSYDEVLDVAVEYTFPASDPVAVQSACNDVAARERGEEPPRDG
jgi:hypothetical protein